MSTARLGRRSEFNPGPIASYSEDFGPNPSGARMRSVLLKGTVGGALLLSSLWLGGCATEDYVDTHIAAVRGEVANVQQQAAANSTKISEQDGRLARLDGQVQTVQARADDAYKLAQGKFTVAQVSEDSVHFKVGSAKLSDEDQDKLAALATRLKAEDKNVRLEINGHTDSSGSVGFNYRLAGKRAQTVYEYLANQGVPLNRMEMMAHGEDKPSGYNMTREGRTQNRRTDISVVQ